MKKQVRQTSIDCYKQIKAEGLLSKMRFKVYEFVMWNANCTARESAEGLGIQTNQSGRFTELKELGVIMETGKRNCKVTGNKAITWDVTRELPKKPVKNQKQTKVISVKDAEQMLNKRQKDFVYVITKDGVSQTKMWL